MALLSGPQEGDPDTLKRRIQASTPLFPPPRPLLRFSSAAHLRLFGAPSYMYCLHQGPLPQVSQEHHLNHFRKLFSLFAYIFLTLKKYLFYYCCYYYYCYYCCCVCADLRMHTYVWDTLEMEVQVAVNCCCGYWGPNSGLVTGATSALMKTLSLFRSSKALLKDREEGRM